MVYFRRFLFPFALLAVIHLSSAITIGESDCNYNGVEDSLELAECSTIERPIEVVFVIDTSLSMEQKIEGLCLEILDAITSVRDGDVGNPAMEILVEILPIGKNDNGQHGPAIDECTCCSTTETVRGKYCSVALCLPEVIGICPEEEFDSAFEDWAPATGVVAANKDWGPGPRIVIPISDEGPRCGGKGSGNNPVIDEHDEAAIDHAIPIAFDNRVIVSSIVSGDEITTLAQELAAGAYPGGKVFDIGAKP